MFSQKNFDILLNAAVKIQSSTVLDEKILAVISCDGYDRARDFLFNERSLLDSEDYHMIALSSDTDFEEMGNPLYSVVNSKGSFASLSEIEELDQSIIPVESQKAIDIEVTLGCIFQGKAIETYRNLLRDDPERFASILAVGGELSNTDDGESYLVHRLDFPRKRGWTGVSLDEIKSENLEPFFTHTSNYLDPEHKLPDCADQVTERSICSELKDLASCGDLDGSLSKINYYMYWIGGSPFAFGDLDETESGEYIGPMVVVTFKSADGCAASITWEEVTNWDFEE